MITPRARAASQISRAGNTRPVGLVMPLKLSTRVRGPRADTSRSSSSPESRGLTGISISRSVMPDRAALTRQHEMPLPCS